MYAIFETGGKQYKVAAGDVLRIEKVAGAAGDSIKFINVIAFSDDNGSLETGTPFLDAAVNATILGEGKNKKVIIFKFKAKKDYRKKNGHRQPFTEIEIENFTVGGKTVGKKPEKPVQEEPIEEALAEPEPVKEDVEPEEVVTEEVPAETEAEKLADEVAEDAPASDQEAVVSKLTKADIMAKLDELGATYVKSAKKDELLAILAEAESK
jgi:large subunit ribosomal protein L21